MREDGKLDYLELPATDMAAHKAFYASAFGWVFQDYGPDYAAFGEGLDGGFTTETMTPKPLPILYARDLEAMQARVQTAGGESPTRSSPSRADGASTSATRPATTWPSGPRPDAYLGSTDCAIRSAASRSAPVRLISQTWISTGAVGRWNRCSMAIRRVPSGTMTETRPAAVTCSPS